MPHHSFISPLGELTLFEDNGCLISLDWGRAPDGEMTPLLKEAQTQLNSYLAGRLTKFDLPLSPPGSAFDRKVWNLLATIPYGQTRSYGNLAEILATSPRAIGGSCGRNPLPILIPCHRVITASGGLGGYSGSDGIETKRFLLNLEQDGHIPN